jgi:GNAT superfamily N-acetyltransferase
MVVRLLTSADAALLEAFLVLHRDSSMFLRANARLAGLEYRGQPFQALYAGAFPDGRDDALIGVVAHCWNGMLLMQAPEPGDPSGGTSLLAELARACVRWSARPVTGLSGPLDQVRRARSALGLAGAAAVLEGDETLFALDLSDLIVPAALTSGSIVCRAPLDEERATLYAWRLAYDIEAFGVSDSPERRQRSAEFLDAQIAAANAWVALVDAVPVSLSAFNASLPDIVQLGGIYTPPPLRGRGYAKAAVAASLIAARERGVSRAVLFTANPSAMRSYQALGFRPIGDYSLVFLR